MGIREKVVKFLLLWLQKGKLAKVFGKHPAEPNNKIPKCVLFMNSHYFLASLSGGWGTESGFRRRAIAKKRLKLVLVLLADVIRKEIVGEQEGFLLKEKECERDKQK